jgi:hypothetical protein
MTKVLWLSRHPMVAEQLEALGDVEVVHLNVTFPAVGDEAAAGIRALAKEHGASTVAGVFPAHVVAALFNQCITAGAWNDQFIPKGLKLMMPISVPAPAKDGEVRGGGFSFSHWESASI